MHSLGRCESRSTGLRRNGPKRVAVFRKLHNYYFAVRYRPRIAARAKRLSRFINESKKRKPFWRPPDLIESFTRSDSHKFGYKEALPQWH